VSVRVMADVWDSALQGSTAVHVMAVLANSSDDDGMNCFPGTELIARRARVSERTVIRTIQELEQAGYLRVQRRGGGAGWFSEYCLNTHRLHQEAEATREQERERKLKKRLRKGCHSVTLSPQKRVTPATRICDIDAGKGDIGVTPLYVLPVLDPSWDTHPQPLASEGRREVELGHAVDQVCSALSIENRRKQPMLLRAIALAAEKGELPATIALDMIAAVRDQDVEHARGRLKYKFGLKNFIGDGIWRDRNRWAWDVEAMRLQAEARVGSR
jgi:hypothetical protein